MTTPTEREALLLKEMRHIAGISNGQVKRVADAVLAQCADALKLAVRQNGHDMLMTGDELRKCEKAIAALEAEAAQGWKLVPERMTPEMWNAGCCVGELVDHHDLPTAYAALLAAAPQPPQAVPQKPCASMPRCSVEGAEKCCGVEGVCTDTIDVYLAPQPPQAERVPMTEAEIDTAIKEVIELRMPNFPANCKNAAVEVAHAVAVAMQSRHGTRSKS